MPADAAQHAMVTRSDVVEAVGYLFAQHRELSKQELVDAARTAGRDDVADLLLVLPEHGYWDPRQLWADLPELPSG